MAVKGGFYFNIGNKKLPVGKSSLKEIKKAILTPAAAEIRNELAKDKKYDHTVQTIVLKAENYRQPHPPKKAKVVAQKQLDKFDEIARKTKYFLISLIFFRLVARTPVDEDYWTYEKDKTKKPWELEDIYYYATDPKTGKRVLRKRSESRIYEHEAEVKRRFHKADDRRIRDEWYLKLGSFSSPFCSTDFNLDYDTAFKKGVSNTSSSEIRKIMNEMGALDNFPDFENYEIWNTSPYFVTLEFGKYEDKTNIKDKKTIGKAERYHGTTNGYSVQAPLGLLGRTLAEFSELERMAQEEARFQTNFGYGSRFMSKFVITKESKVSEKFKPIKYKTVFMNGEKRVKSFYVEDLVNAACENKKTISLREFEPPYSDKYGINTYAPEFDRKWKERKESSRWQKRKQKYELVRQVKAEYKDMPYSELAKTEEFKKMIEEEKQAKAKQKEEKDKLKVEGKICGETKNTVFSALQKLADAFYGIYFPEEKFDPKDLIGSSYQEVWGLEIDKDGDKVEVNIVDENENSLPFNVYIKKFKKNPKQVSELKNLINKLVDDAVKKGNMEKFRGQL